MEVQSELILPRWDRRKRELWFKGILCKRFLQDATAQMALLDAFEKNGWPERIRDPLPPLGYVDPNQRLADAVRRLNNCRHLRFERDGTGKGLRWKVR